MGTKWLHPLGLSKIEFNVIRYAMLAQSKVSNGHFLTGNGHQKRAAIKLVGLGYLTKPRRKGDFFPPGAWGIVIVITKKNVAKYNSDLKRALARGRKQKGK